jgi:hypothetical protein
MQTVTILRELWRLRLLVVLTGIVAVVAALNVAYEISPSKVESRKYSVGIATARILVDTPDSQVIEVAPEGSDATGVRANLLANLMVEGEIKAVIADRAGLRPSQLEGVSKTAADPNAAATPPDPRGYVLTTDVLTGQDGERLPIIEIEAQAPDSGKAAHLAQAAITGLRDHLDTRAAAEHDRDADRLQLNPLGAPQARDVVRGPRLALAIGAGIFVFLAGCAAILGFFALVRAWRAVEYEKQSRLAYDLAVIDGDDAEPPTTARDGAGDEGVTWAFPRPTPPAESDEVAALGGGERRAESA